MEQFIFKNSRGNSITIDQNNNSQYILQSYDGLTASEIIPITTSGYNQIGNTFIGNKLGVRLINISFYVYGDSMVDFYEKRRNLAKIFNPTIGEAVLNYKNDFIDKSINVSISASPYPTEKNGNLQLFTVELIAHNPLFYDTSINALKLGDFIGGLRYPLIFDPSVKFANKGEVAFITINGDVPSPLSVEFRDNSLNPKLTLLNTGEFIQVDTEIEDGEKLIVNTAYGNKTAIHTAADGTETSAYNLITPDSTFFSLPIGDNQISFQGDAGLPEVYIYWRQWFLGV